MAVPLPLQTMYGAHLIAKDGLVMEWRIHEPSKWRPAGALNPRMQHVLWEYPRTEVLLVPLHLGMWHPHLEAYPRCERHEELTTRC